MQVTICSKIQSSITSPIASPFIPFYIVANFNLLDPSIQPYNVCLTNSTGQDMFVSNSRYFSAQEEMQPASPDLAQVQQKPAKALQQRVFSEGESLLGAFTFSC